MTSNSAESQISERKPAETEADLYESLRDFAQILQDSTAAIGDSLVQVGKAFARALLTQAAEQEALLAQQRMLHRQTRDATEEARIQASAAVAAVAEAIRMQEDRAGLTTLINDLRHRIAALSVLAAPLPTLEQTPPETAQYRGKFAEGE